jgi:hypothetical protein
MLSAEDLNIILDYVSKVSGRSFRSMDDFVRLDTGALLELFEKIDDAILPVFISMFKSTRHGRELFHKITENLDESSAQRTKAFLKRYMDLIIRQEDSNKDFNPLLIYLVRECFDDLVFMQSRQAFFLRQTIDTINEFLHTSCGCTDVFSPGSQEEAWQWFWNYLLKI